VINTKAVQMTQATAAARAEAAANTTQRRWLSLNARWAAAVAALYVESPGDPTLAEYARLTPVTDKHNLAADLSAHACASIAEL
jgi:hypothetical protein